MEDEGLSVGLLLEVDADMIVELLVDAGWRRGYSLAKRERCLRSLFTTSSICRTADSTSLTASAGTSALSSRALPAAERTTGMDVVEKATRRDLVMTLLNMRSNYLLSINQWLYL